MSVTSRWMLERANPASPTSSVTAIRGEKKLVDVWREHDLKRSEVDD